MRLNVLWQKGEIFKICGGLGVILYGLVSDVHHYLWILHLKTKLLIENVVLSNNRIFWFFVWRVLGLLLP